ncbi:protealysin inhibitor emfourin [Microbacterium sp. A93]|uniref:protealysin inhibitor emfourin n=1 Tax=Microbacterium sp. A93 TaxID=3450716 RepID=UPI003F4445DB
MSDVAPQSEPDDGPRILIAVIRTGGIAGIRRHWQVEPPREEMPRWVELIDRCPWEEPCPTQRGADRYIWSIRAHTPDVRHERELPESALDGPWRRLVDAVREASATPDSPASRA